MESELKRCLVDEAMARSLTVTYDDTHGLWGGTRLAFHGDGRLERELLPRGSDRLEVKRGDLAPGKLTHLVALLLEVRAWEQRTPEASPLPDESRARLQISVNGRACDTWERFNELESNGRLIRIKEFLDSL